MTVFSSSDLLVLTLFKKTLYYFQHVFHLFDPHVLVYADMQAVLPYIFGIRELPSS